ncbi:expressed unknown protein [Seminavis robusta]|uniref:Uncharacterized protein n=1 Tax=Seminavis robusta TaxID=568900 RepID=A0A9N8EWN0_9STRA|nr:expressed unknown protein [Seminavis robusta]|eukprot:Sro1771_g296640.1 n/a (426) ;mRNA; r:11207-12484
MVGTASVASSIASSTASACISCRSHTTLRRPQRRPSLGGVEEEATAVDHKREQPEETEAVIIMDLDDHCCDAENDDDDDGDSSCSSDCATQVTSNTNPHRSSITHDVDSHIADNTHSSSSATHVTSNQRIHSSSGDVVLTTTNTRPRLHRNDDDDNPLDSSFSLMRVDMDNSRTSGLTETTDMKATTSSMERWSSGEPGRRNSTSGGEKQKSTSSQKSGSVSFAVEDDDDDDDDGDDWKSKPAMVGEGITTLEEEEEDDRMTCASEPTKGSSNGSSSSMLLTEDRIRSHMFDYYEDYDSIFRHGKNSKACWESFFQQYFTDDILWIRSTGNPIGKEGLAHLLSEDVSGISMTMVSIDSIQILAGGMAAVVVFTADQEYLYRGQPEADRTVITSVLQVVNGCEILIGHEHRCAGKPIPKETRWEAS